MNGAPDQVLRDHRLSVEYAYLKDNAPSGVLLLPELNSIRRFHGTVFIRTGSYKGGVFRFTLLLPETYNSTGSFPEIKFTPSVFNPLVDADTGRMSLFIDNELMKEWDPSKHFLSTALACVKKIFHIQSYDLLETGDAPNERARNLFECDRASFLKEVCKSIEYSSQDAIINRPSNELNCIRFSEPLPAHEFLRETVVGELLAAREREQKQLLNSADQSSGPQRGHIDRELRKKERPDSVAEARQTLTRVRASSSSSSSSSSLRGDDSSGRGSPSLPITPSPNSKSRRLRSFFDATLGDSTDECDNDSTNPRSSYPSAGSAGPGESRQS